LTSIPGHGRPLRTVFLSDVHLGSRACRVDLLLDFLRRTRCETLYLVGDIIDLESLRHSFYWPESHTEVLALLMRRCREGMRIVYIPGNHDDELRAFAGAELGNIEIKREAVHTTRCGRKLLVIHGDEFDAVVRGRSLGVVLGAFACRRLLTLNRFVHWLADVFGRRYWSLAQHVKARIPAAKGYVARFEEAVLDAARKAGADGVVCGHIHKADLREQDGLVYCNDGDWVESCTALVEDVRGRLSLIEWRPSRATMAAAAVALSVAVAMRTRVAEAIEAHAVDVETVSEV
jgi:UDP-2,3-diacylglucosamine pyrophosphatase LpxH